MLEMLIKHPIKIIIFIAISYSVTLFYFEYEKQLAVQHKENYFPLLELCYHTTDMTLAKKMAAASIPCKAKIAM
jgi:hypothetical protein